MLFSVLFNKLTLLGQEAGTQFLRSQSQTQFGYGKRITTSIESYNTLATGKDID